MSLMRWWIRPPRHPRAIGAADKGADCGHGTNHLLHSLARPTKHWAGPLLDIGLIAYLGGYVEE
jgi:hypothetical protein